MKAKIKRGQLRKIADKIASRGFSSILHDNNLMHLLSFFAFRKNRHKKENLPDPSSLVRLLEELGPGFLEAAKIAASRSDLIPVLYQNDLLNLSYKLNGLRSARHDAVLRRELGRKAARRIASIDKAPYHINLLSNTHQGILYDGRRVLVTVNDRNSVDEFRRNIEQIRWVLDWILPNIDKDKALVWKSVFSELEARSELITDLTLAASREEILSSQFEKNSKIEIPKVYWEYTTPGVLTQSFENLPDWRAIASGSGRGSFSKRYLVKYLLEAFVFQYGVGGHFLLRPSLDNWQAGAKNKIVFNNFLATGYLEPSERRAFILLLRSLLESDAALASKVLLSMHYVQGGAEEYHKSGLCMPDAAGDTVSEKLWFALERAWDGRLIVPLGISQAAESILYLESAIRHFDDEIDLADGLLCAIKKKTEEIFGAKEASLSCLKAS